MKKLILSILLVSLLSGCSTPKILPEEKNPIKSDLNVETKSDYSNPDFNENTDSFDELVNSFPFTISQEKKDQSLMQGTTIGMSPTEDVRESQILDLLNMKGWKLIATDLYNDGGSHTSYYFKNKRTPAISISFSRDMFKGVNKYIGVKFIHPARIGSWLLKIDPESLEEGININALMGCDGILRETHPGFAECIKE